MPLRRQVAISEPTDALSADFPRTIWDDDFHLRVRDGRVLLLRPSPGDPADPWSDRVDPAWLDDIAAAAPVRVPALRGVALDRPRAWAGLYEMSPDHHVILGWAPGCPDLLLVNGSSRHGVMHAPALGLLAAKITAHGTARSLDVPPAPPIAVSPRHAGVRLGGAIATPAVTACDVPPALASLPGAGSDHSAVRARFCQTARCTESC